RYGWSLASAFMQGLRDGSEHACLQVVVVAGEGGDGEMACLAISLAADAVEQVVKGLDLIDQEATDWLVQGIYEPKTDLNNNLLSVQASNGNTQAQIAQLQTQILALQFSMNALQAQLANTTYTLSQKSNVNNDMDQQIMKLLLSPDGSRN